MPPAPGKKRSATSSDRVAHARLKIVNAYQRPVLMPKDPLVRMVLVRKVRPRG